MKILVDADSCPVKDIIVKTAKKYNLEVIMFFDTSHIYEDDYSKVLTVDKGRDSADFALINFLKKGDIVVTGDYGVASLALTKIASALNQNGLIYTNMNIDTLLYNRYIGSKIRSAGGKTKGPKKRNSKDDKSFEESLMKLIENYFNSFQ